MAGGTIYNSYILFARVDYPNPANPTDPTWIPLRLCNASQGWFPVETEWGKYLPMGGLMEIRNRRDKDNVDAEYFDIVLGLTTKDLVRRMMDAEIQDNDVVIHRANGAMVTETFHVEGVGDVTRECFRFGKPVLERLGRVSQVDLTSEGMRINCYTASADLDAVVSTASHWTDTQQRKRTDLAKAKDDYGFRYANRYFDDEGVITT